MKLHALRISEFRGIRKLELAPGGQSLCIFGPNGSGKSSVVDAVDFLLTGRVRRLSGEGTKDISLGRHAKHVLALPADSWVEAEVESSLHVGSRCVIRRTLANPEHLESDVAVPEDVLAQLDAASSTASHLLTRREILKFILIEPADRLQQVSILLRISRIETLRKEFGGASRDASDASKQCEAIVTSRARTLLQSVSPEAPDTAALFAAAERHRTLLGAPSQQESTLSSVLTGVTPPVNAATSALQSPRVRSLLQTSAAWLGSLSTDLLPSLASLADDTAALRANAGALQTLKGADLISRGLDLISGDECPLCLLPWEKARLHDLLTSRSKAAASAAVSRDALVARQQAIRTSLTTGASDLGSLLTALGKEDLEASDLLSAVISLVTDSLKVIGRDVLSSDFTDREAAMETLPLTSIHLLSDRLAILQARASRLDDLAGLQKAWDELTGITKSNAELLAARDAHGIAKTVAKHAANLDALFVRARDDVLDNLYQSVSTRFADLYRSLQGDDETTFGAEFAPTKAGLKLEVSFYDAGTHPPSALHSEGHQDSMGICLFLALTELMVGGVPAFMILDDVVMSVDHSHRRAMAELLRDSFPTVQFLLTTHDRVWWRQLQSTAVITRKNSLEFRNWSLGAGPESVDDAAVMLASAKQAFAKGDVSRSAHQLRRTVECHFRDVCDMLGAPVRFRGDGTNGAGEFVLAAQSRLAELLKKARNAHTSWGISVEAVNALDEARKAASKGFSEENWAVNQLVHYNEWAEMNGSDFAPVLQAYEALFAVFFCTTCGGSYFVTEDGPTLTGLRCACNTISFNLKAKS